MEVWGDEDKLEAAREQRTVNKEKAKKKKFDKRVKGKGKQLISFKVDIFCKTDNCTEKNHFEFELGYTYSWQTKVWKEKEGKVHVRPEWKKPQRV